MLRRYIASIAFASLTCVHPGLGQSAPAAQNAMIDLPDVIICRMKVKEGIEIDVKLYQSYTEVAFDQDVHFGAAAILDGAGVFAPDRVWTLIATGNTGTIRVATWPAGASSRDCVEGTSIEDIARLGRTITFTRK